MNQPLVIDWSAPHTSAGFQFYFLLLGCSCEPYNWKVVILSVLKVSRGWGFTYRVLYKIEVKTNAAVRSCDIFQLSAFLILASFVTVDDAPGDFFLGSCDDDSKSCSSGNEEMSSDEQSELDLTLAGQSNRTAADNEEENVDTDVNAAKAVDVPLSSDGETPDTDLEDSDDDAEHVAPLRGRGHGQGRDRGVGRKE